MSTKNVNEIILAEDGTIVRRSITEQVIEAGDSVIETIASGVVRKAERVFEVPGWGPVNLAVANGGDYYTMRLHKLPLKANFKIDDGILYPRFSASKEPVMPMVWTPPEDMALAMLILMYPDGGRHVVFEYQWIFAFDKEKRSYRLPLGNLFDDAKLCTGQMKNGFPTAQACFAASLEQLEKSQWQGDLDRAPDSTQRMFRFKPLNDGFAQEPIAGTWQSLSSKISHATVNFVHLGTL